MQLQGWTRSPIRKVGWFCLGLGIVLAGTGCGGEPRQNVRILLPENGDRFVQGADTLVFQAQLATLDPSNLEGFGLQWTSSLDGIFHKDELEFELPADSLSVGEHVITIVAPVQGGWVSHEIRITIEAAAAAFSRLEPGGPYVHFGRYLH
jgi:hypothetical protein